LWQLQGIKYVLREAMVKQQSRQKCLGGSGSEAFHLQPNTWMARDESEVVSRASVWEMSCVLVPVDVRLPVVMAMRVLSPGASATECSRSPSATPSWYLHQALLLQEGKKHRLHGFCQG
jgi:hypothetical protein